MTHPTSRSAVLLVTLVALLAGSAGALLTSVGTASAVPGAVAAQLGKDKGKGKGHKPKGPLNRKQVTKISKKLAKKTVAAWAPSGSVGNAGALGGQPPSAYQSTAYTVALAPVTTAVRDKTWTLPAVPAGTYQANLSLTATMSSSTLSLYCALFQGDTEPDLLTAYGVSYNQSITQSWRTVDASRVITVTGAMKLQCRALPDATTNRITAVPANPNYAAPQISFVKLDAATALGTAQ